MKRLIDRGVLGELYRVSMTVSLLSPAGLLRCGFVAWYLEG
jgi:hypothetical protein